MASTLAASGSFDKSMIGHPHLLGCDTVYRYSGGSRIFERGVQVQADYGGLFHHGRRACLWSGCEVGVHPREARKISEFRTFEIASAGFSGPIQQWRRKCSGRSGHGRYTFLAKKKEQ